ncbi:MAG: sensor domain-containing diguanylate cyclase [Deltaproteobacteria bacterium]|nr:sensor domain-containing diguanylate cyclase [Deltaproteobacteria bacterium]
MCIDKEQSYLELLLEQLVEGAYIVNNNKKIVFWNSAAEDITGFPKKDIINKVCGVNGIGHVSSNGKSMCKTSCPINPVYDRDCVSVIKETFLHHKLGYRVPVTVKVLPWKNAEGITCGAIEIFSKIESKSYTQSRIETLEKLAYIDELTSLPNRRFLLSRIDLQLNELRRYDWHFGLLFLDIDNFKQINDNYGHQTGDKVLKIVAATLNEGKRSLDTVGRYGGEEFLAIISNIDRNELLHIAERLRYMVETSSIRSNFPISITISIGASTAHVDDTVESLIERADINMYNSKQQGRNRVTG